VSTIFLKIKIEKTQNYKSYNSGWLKDNIKRKITFEGKSMVTKNSTKMIRPEIVEGKGDARAFSSL
jgi:hypothetical protein